MLPHDFPNYKTVNHYYNQWRREGRWDQILQALNQLYRQHQGRESTPSAGALDSQSVKTVALSGVHGYDGGKKLNGRKRHIVVDTLGLLMAIVVTSAKAGDGEVAPQVLEQVTPERYPRFLLLWADRAYEKYGFPAWVAEHGYYKLEIKKRNPNADGFEVIAKRWVVERTFGWLMWHRRLSKDYEHTLNSSENMVRIALIQIMLKRLQPTPGQKRLNIRTS